MKIQPSHNLKARADLDGTLGKNLADGLVRPVQELTKAVTETSSKLREPKTHDKAINNPVHGNRWRRAINEELWN